MEVSAVKRAGGRAVGAGGAKGQVGGALLGTAETDGGGD